ncbi:MAG: HNH endonuclease [Shinella sp.]|uniref:HNH endonuclease n=1 Tax=Shinella sp. TaxID=1870904 RepID=UPI0040366A61
MSKSLSGRRKRAIIALLFHLQEGRCCYCRKFLRLRYAPHYRSRHDSATLEHLRRRADGGRHYLDNLALACKSCNDGRGVVDWLTYASWIRNEF